MLTSPGPRRMIATPSRISSPPRVTMNDGILIRATSDPCMAPTAAQASSAAMIAAHHGQLRLVGCTSSATTTLPNAMTRPTERSISPSSRAKISAIASTMYTVLCSNRLTRFCADRNAGFATWKLTATTAMARTTGRTPLSPLRTRSHQARRYWPSDWASTSGGTSAAAASGAAVRSVAIAASAVPAGVSPGSAVPGMSGTGHAPSRPAAGQHVNQHCGDEHDARHDVLQRRGQLTQAEKGHAVGDGADEEAAENTVDRLTPAAEEADPADDGGGHRVQDELTGVCRIGAVLTEEKGAEQYAAEAGGRGAQREGPGADGGEADAGAAGRFGVATDGVDVAAEAGPLGQGRQDAKDDQDDRDHPRNSPHRHQWSSAVDGADQHHRCPDQRHQGDSDCCHAGRGSHQALAAPRGRAQPQARADGPHHHRQGYPAGKGGNQPLDQVIEDPLV